MSKEHGSGMSVIVKTVTRLTVGLILLYGIYIVLHGHLTPGGGFAGGVIIALSLVHLVLAFGKQTALKRVSEPVMEAFESLGAVFFLALAVMGFAGASFAFDGGHFFIHDSEPDVRAQVRRTLLT